MIFVSPDLSWAALGRSWPLLGRSWAALGALLAARLAGCQTYCLASWLPGGRIQAPEAQNARDCSHRACVRGGGKDFGSGAAPLTAARSYQDLKILDPRHS